MQFKILKSKDNVEGLLDSNIGASTLTIPLEAGDGASFPATYTGTTTSLGSTILLNKTGIGASGVAVGDFIENITDGSHAFVIGVNTDSLNTTVLNGGSDNTWQNADAYAVNRFIATLNKRDADGVITDYEKVLIDSRATDILTVNASGRGYDGSVAQTFVASDYVNIFVTDLHLSELRKALAEMAQNIDLRYTKTEIDALLQARNWKQPVRVASTAALTLATGFENGDTIDGVALVTGDRILIKDQASPIENGIYTVNASGAPTRATDFDAGETVTDSVVPVDLGTSNADTVWICTSSNPTVGTDNVVFVQIAASLAKATTAQALAGTEDTAYITPEKLRAAIVDWPHVEFFKNISFTSTPSDAGTDTPGTTVSVTPLAHLDSGDLVVIFAHYKGAVTLTMSDTGGQSWTALTAAAEGSNMTSRIFYCLFNGTWSSTPSVTNTAGTLALTVSMSAFRGVHQSTPIDVTDTGASYAAPGGSFDVTITGITTLTNNALVVAFWTSEDDNTWTLQTANWRNLGGVAQVRNGSGTDQSMSTGYFRMPAAGGCGNVTNRQATLGGDAGTTHIFAIKPADGDVVRPVDLWVKKTSKFYKVKCIGAGGGGGSGRSTNNATARYGGGGGGGGGSNERTFQAADLPTDIVVTIGIGGAGGAAATGAAGNVGTVGGNTSFSTYLTAFGGGGGAAGVASNQSGGGGGGAGGVGEAGTTAASLGGVPAVTAGVVGAGGMGGGGVLGGAGAGAEYGGAGGGGVSSIGTAMAGGSSINAAPGGGAGGEGAGGGGGGAAGGVSGSWTAGGGGAGAAATSGVGTAGTDSTTLACGTGGGGGGAAGSADAVGGAGGAGGDPGAGGGGGGAATNLASGVGGRGGDGATQVFSW